MKRRLLTALATIALMLALSPIVNAGTQGSCSGSDASKLELYENGAGDTSDGNDDLWACGDVSNLSGLDHTLPGNCNAFVPKGDWNDCATDLRPYIPTGWNLCLYGNGLYGGSKATWPHSFNGVRRAAPWNDGLSSFRWLPTSTLC